MNIRVGTDLVHIKKFARAAGRTNFLEKMFTARELANKDIEHLAGLFAAKEALIKALSLSAGSWHSFEIKREKSGRPRINFLNSDLDSIKSCDLSISHDGQYCLAIAVVIL